MAKFDEVTGRYVYLEIEGVEYRVYFEEAGSGVPLVLQHTVLDEILSKSTHDRPATA